MNGAGPWGFYLFRTPKGGRPQQLFFAPDSNGDLVVINRKLYIRYCDKNWIQWWAEVPGYIDPDNQPSSQTINVNEAAMAVYKQQVALAQNTANGAMAQSQTANNQVESLRAEVRRLQAQIATLTQQQQQMAQQILSKSQIEDIVWAKIWDVNYLIRMGFLQGSSTIQQVQDYLNDLTVFIKRVVGK
ncbi:MAG: hypothetical protein ACK5XN_04145 [Bacteroidota bacterium]